MSDQKLLVLDAAEQTRAPLKSCVIDILAGIKRYELWGVMGWLDISQRYSRSIMGPFWVTLTLGVFAASIGLVYGQIFKIKISEYLPYLTVGTVVWAMLSSYLTEGCGTFISSEPLIKQIQAPLSVFIFRLLWRNLIIFAHNVVVVFVVLLLFGINFFPGLPLALGGLVMVVINGVGFCAILGVLSARFRDIPPLMASIVQLLFFMTPILWQPQSLDRYNVLVDANPFYHLVNLVRAPLLGESVSLYSWLFVIFFSTINLGVALLLYARFRWRVPYWL